MTDRTPHITVCICTFRRLALLNKLLGKLADQETGGKFTYSVVVTDNDDGESARPVVAQFTTGSPIQTVYCVETERNIALVRNCALKHASGEFVAFIDDDEYPEKAWLLSLYTTCLNKNVAGVLGPVRPYFDQEPPSWVRKGGFFERLEHPTGFVMDWKECRTGNVLFRSAILVGLENPFDREFRTGGEDRDFFMRMSQAGHVFVWCNEAAAYELVPPSRWQRNFMLSRGLLRGQHNVKSSIRDYRAIAKSVLAVPLYGLALPFMFVAGQALFMKYAIKFCDHAGRLLGLLGLNLISERKM